MKKWLVFAISFLLFIPFASINGSDTPLLNNSNGNILYVGGSDPNNYTSIQSAINDAEDGYTIYVYYGMYNESVVINKSISLIGIEQNGEKPIINGSINESKKVVTIGADNVTFKNFVVMYGRGLGLLNATDNVIENNKVMYSDGLGLSLYNSSNNLIKSNKVCYGKDNGIHVKKSSNNIITQNYVVSNEYKGIAIFSDSCGNIISYNNITKNQDGIDLDYRANNCTISSNHIYYNDQYGIAIDNTLGISIVNNTIYHHSYGGIMLVDSSYCVIKGNEIYNNSWGISLEGNMRIPWSENVKNVVTRNNIYNNGYGIYLSLGRENSFIGNNLVDNDCNAGFSQALEFDDPNPAHPIHNTWNANYWSDWNLPTPKPIKGELEIAIPLFGNYYGINVYWFMFDKHPAMEPYKI